MTAKRLVLLAILSLLTAGCVMELGDESLDGARNGDDATSERSRPQAAGARETILDHTFTMAGDFAETVDFDVPEEVRLLRIILTSSGAWVVHDAWSFSGPGDCRTTGGSSGLGGVSVGAGNGNDVGRGECTAVEAGAQTLTVDAHAVGDFRLEVEAVW